MSATGDERLAGAHQSPTRVEAELLAHPTLIPHLTNELEARTRQALQHLHAHPSAWNADPNTLDSIAQRIADTIAGDRPDMTGNGATSDSRPDAPIRAVPRAIDIPRRTAPEPPGIELA